MGNKFKSPSGSKVCPKSIRTIPRVWCGHAHTCAGYHCDDYDFVIPRDKSWNKTKDGGREKRQHYHLTCNASDNSELF